jgi:arylsulfatase A-like enzyme
MVMYDSLNRHMLPPYGCEWVQAPNFERLAHRAVTFQNAYVGSMPCMPARRELHTGRYNLLHRSWGPLEPYDDSMPELLKGNGIYTHLTSDHQHYWEDGGCTYHTRYSTWGISRGQEGDPWKAEVADPEFPASVSKRRDKMWRQDWINRKYMQREEDQPQAKTFAEGLAFIHTNHAEDNWFLQIETFDPHEPYFTQEHYKDLYPHDYDGPHFDWPPYAPVSETPDQVEHMRFQNAALISMCDAWLGKVLDLMDEYDLWQDTMLIINTDHGFLLGEHGWWAKCVQPFYNEVALMPLFIWDPRCSCRDERRTALVQTIDLPATLLEYFGVELPPDMQGLPLRETIASDVPVREAGLYGLHGGHVNVTDGRHVYMRAPANPENVPLYNYTLMPTHMRQMFTVQELRDAELVEPFSFTKGCPLLKVRARGWPRAHPHQTMLFDLQDDPKQEHPINDPAVEKRMIDHLIRLMRENDSPVEQFERLGLPL